MIDIFYKSYNKDFSLLYISLLTLAKNVTGYNNVVILIPENERHGFDTRNLPPRTLIHYVSDRGKGYLRQQVYKLQAHKFCDAEYILFADSDCMWDHPIDVSQFIADGRPEILYTPWEKVGDAIVWKKPISDIVGVEMPYEFMRRNCMIYHKSTLQNIDKWRPDLEKIVMNASRFSEFNLMGFWAYLNEPEKYNFVCTDNWEYVPPKAIQVWSHASKNEGASELHLREYIRTLETIIQCFNIPIQIDGGMALRDQIQILDNAIKTHELPTP